MCDLSNGRDACGSGFYCQDSMRARNGAGGGGGGGGAGFTGVVISGPSGQIVTGNGGNAANGRNGMSARSFGVGTCVRFVRAGGRCENNDECGGYSCVGLGGSTATGGVITGSSGQIVWGTGVATSGFCG